MVAALGLWARPRLDLQARFVGLTWRQWQNLGVLYVLGRWGWQACAPVLPSLPRWLLIGWLILIGLMGVASVLVTWHGRDVWGVLSLWVTYHSTPRIHVWRPLPATQIPTHTDTEEEHDDWHDDPAPSDANPGGWLLPAA